MIYDICFYREIFRRYLELRYVYVLTHRLGSSRGHRHLFKRKKTKKLHIVKIENRTLMNFVPFQWFLLKCLN